MSITLNRVLIWGRKVEIVLSLAAARAMVRILPYRWLKRTMGDVGVATDSMADPMARVGDPALDQARQIGRHIAQMAKRMPFKASCLPQAMTARWMLARRNQKSQIIIGVRKSENGSSIDLHAWLMAGEQCVTGERERRGFIQFQRETVTDLERT